MLRQRIRDEDLTVFRQSLFKTYLQSVIRGTPARFKIYKGADIRERARSIRTGWIQLLAYPLVQRQDVKIIHIDRCFPCELTAESQIELLAVWFHLAGRRDVAAGNDGVRINLIAQQIYVGCTRTFQEHKSVAKSIEHNGHCGDFRNGHIVVNPVASTNDGSGVILWIPCKPDARRKIVRVVLRFGTVDEPDTPSSQRMRKFIMLQQPGLQIVTDAEVQGQIFSRMPIVLNVEAVLLILVIVEHGASHSENCEKRLDIGTEGWIILIEEKRAGFKQIKQKVHAQKIQIRSNLKFVSSVS